MLKFWLFGNPRETDDLCHIFLGGGITGCREQGAVIPASRGVGSRRLGHFRERMKSGGLHLFLEAALRLGRAEGAVFFDL
jgi:hypothetical protein